MISSFDLLKFDLLNCFDLNKKKTAKISKKKHFQVSTFSTQRNTVTEVLFMLKCCFNKNIITTDRENLLVVFINIEKKEKKFKFVSVR